jgi:hypothetical protein
VENAGWDKQRANLETACVEEMVRKPGSATDGRTPFRMLPGFVELAAFGGS